MPAIPEMISNSIPFHSIPEGRYQGGVGLCSVGDIPMRLETMQ